MEVVGVGGYDFFACDVGGEGRGAVWVVGDLAPTDRSDALGNVFWGLIGIGIGDDVGWGRLMAGNGVGVVGEKLFETRSWLLCEILLMGRHRKVLVFGLDVE